MVDVLSLRWSIPCAVLLVLVIPLSDTLEIFRQEPLVAQVARVSQSPAVARSPALHDRPNGEDSQSLRF